MHTAYSYLRFSSAEQAKGSSRARQSEAAAQFVARWNADPRNSREALELDDSLRLSDEGVSAYRSRNAQTGALSRFRRLVEDGQVTPGSWLLIENIDRLTRDTADRAVTILLELVRMGVTVYAMTEGRRFDKATLKGEDGYMNLMLALVGMMRAHGESKRKGQLVRDAWQRKFARIETGEQLTKNVPFWLTPERKQRKPEVQLVRRIFRDTAAGIGCVELSRCLNAEGIPTASGRGIWTGAHIRRILSHRAVLGVLEVNQKAADRGAVVEHPGYYPRIISDDQWMRAERMAESRRATKPPRDPAAFAHLLAGLVKCAHCGSTMAAGSKWGTTPKVPANATEAEREAALARRKRYKFFLCGKARFGDCLHHQIPRHLVEDATLFGLSLLQETSAAGEGDEAILEAAREVDRCDEATEAAYDAWRESRTGIARRRLTEAEKAATVAREAHARLMADSGDASTKLRRNLLTKATHTNASLRALLRMVSVNTEDRMARLVPFGGKPVDVPLDSDTVAVL